jgi:hypothetical protein
LSPRNNLASQHCDATLSVFPSTLPLKKYDRCRRWPHLSSTSLELSCPSAYPAYSTLLRTPRSRKASENRLPWSSEVPHPGFGYPLCGVSLRKPEKLLSAPNALRLRPSKLCSFPMIELTFRWALSAPALSYETLADLVPTLQRLPPTGKAVPLYCSSEGLVRTGTNALLGFSTS